MKKIGNLFVAFTPMILSFVLQFAVAIVCSIVCSVIYIVMHMELANDAAALQAGATQFYMDHLIWVILGYQALGLLVFGLWYRFGMKQKNVKIPKNVANVRTITGGLAIGLGLQFATVAALQFLNILLPDLMGSYVEMMELSGIGQTNVVSIIATVILAPIGEEILCRGITLKLAKKVSRNFIIANCIQALAFAILHGNIVQGAYAFIIGYVLGVLYERYNSLYITIFVHFVVNAAATFIVEPVTALLPEKILVFGLVMVAAIAVIVVGLFLAKGDKDSRITEEAAEEAAVKEQEIMEAENTYGTE